MKPAAIETHGLGKRYGESIGIEDLDLEVRPGEIYGFLGPNGAGKTTTLRLLLGLLHPTAGRARVLGLDFRRDSLKIRARVGYLPGELELYEHLTGRQLLRYLGALRGGLDSSFVDELAARLDADLDRPLRALSHGNRQKIGLVQAMMHRPDLLILDEPTLGLDPLVQQQFYELLAELRDGGCTIFFSSHVLPEVERICDRVAMVREGRLIAVEEVIALRSRAVRHLELTLRIPARGERLSQVPGVEDLVVDGHHVRCTVRGPVGPLLTALVEHDVEDVISREPGLEELFLSYYQDHSAAHHA